jgi:hypothetical protein
MVGIGRQTWNYVPSILEKYSCRDLVAICGSHSNPASYDDIDGIFHRLFHSSVENQPWTWKI